MSDDLKDFMRGMDGEWEAVSITKDPDGKTRVTYRSLVVDGLRWSHTPFNSNVVQVGARGRIGWIGNR